MLEAKHFSHKRTLLSCSQARAALSWSPASPAGALLELYESRGIGNWELGIGNWELRAVRGSGCRPSARRCSWVAAFPRWSTSAPYRLLLSGHRHSHESIRHLSRARHGNAVRLLHTLQRLFGTEHGSKQRLECLFVQAYYPLTTGRAQRHSMLRRYSILRPSFVKGDGSLTQSHSNR